MSKDSVNKIYKVVAEVSEEIHVSLRILSLKKRLSLAEYVREVLEKHVTSKSKVIETAEEV
jgi:predicted HicB family RNase H-like nuclease